MKLRINWKKVTYILLDTVLAGYLLLAVTAFNKPDESAFKCQRVEIHIGDNLTDGFLTPTEVKHILTKHKLYPLGQQMSSVNTRAMEELLFANPFVQTAECFKTQNGQVVVSLTQRMPIIRVKNDAGKDFFIDETGSIMPKGRYTTDLIVATGHISESYARKYLTEIGNVIVHDPFWQNQVEQLYVLPDGSLELVPRVGDHIVGLGAPENIEGKLDRLRKFYQYGLNQVGWNKYSYISVEFNNQIICKRKDKTKK